MSCRKLKEGGLAAVSCSSRTSTHRSSEGRSTCLTQIPCLLGVSTCNSADNHQQTHPPKPTQLLIEQQQAEQRSDERLDTRRNTCWCRIDSPHGGKEQEVRRNDGADAQGRDVCPTCHVTRRIRRFAKQRQEYGEKYQPADKLPVQHLL